MRICGLFERGFGRAAQQREATQPITFQYILEVEALDGSKAHEVLSDRTGNTKVFP